MIIFSSNYNYCFLSVTYFILYTTTKWAYTKKTPFIFVVIFNFYQKLKKSLMMSVL